MNETDYKRLWRNSQKENTKLHNTVNAVIDGVMKALKEIVTEEDYKKMEVLVTTLKESIKE